MTANGPNPSPPPTPPSPPSTVRPQPRVGDSLSAGGGLLLLAGALVLGVDLGIDGHDVSRWPVLVIAGVVLAAGFVVPSVLDGTSFGRAGTSACVAVVAVLVPVELGILILWGEPSSGAWRAFFVLVVVAFGALYVVPPFRLRTVMLFGAVLTVWVWVLYEVLASGDSGPVYRSSGRAPVGGIGGFGPSSSTTTATLAVASLVVGVAYLGAVRLLDRRDQSRTATAFVLPAFLALYVGVSAVASEWALWVAGVVAAAVGVLTMVVGTGRRRFTTWTGAIFATLGVGAIIADITDTVTAKGAQFDRGASPKVFAGLAILVGVGLIAAAAWLGGRLGEGDPAVPAPGAADPPVPPIAGDRPD